MGAYFSFELNRNNELTLDITINFTKFDKQKRLTHGFYAKLKYRFKDKFSYTYTVEYTKIRNNGGWVACADFGIVLAEQNHEIPQNDLTGKKY